jgi:hypothetical protein
MPRDVNGNYTLPAGNPVVTATVISSTWANTTLSDLSTAMTNSLDRTGATAGMTGQFKASSGSVGAPGISFGAEVNSGIYRAGAGDFRLSVSAADTIKFAFANPGANKVGLTANNGTSLNPLRSDATAALDQAIVPTWTGIHTFSARPVMNAGATVTGASVTIAGGFAGPVLTVAAPSSGNAMTVAGVAGANNTAITISVSPLFQTTNSTIGFAMNSSGANFGTVQNDSSNTWSLGYGTAFNALGTPVIQWNSSNQSFAKDDGGTLQPIGWRDVPINAQTADYNFALSDRGKLVVNNKAGSNMALGILPEASVAWPPGTTLSCFNNVSGRTILVQRGSGVTMFLAGDAAFTNADRSVASCGLATITKYGTNVWVISGTAVS